MKILWIYKWDPSYHFDHWFHLDFVRNIRKYNPDHEIIAYGERVQEGYPDLAPIRYDRKLTLKLIHEHFAFDRVIVNTKSRCWDYYHPIKGVSIGCNLPPDFATYKTIKVMIEEDFHYETSADWYEGVNFDLVLNRHYSNNLKFKNISRIPTVWFPFSVDETIFFPDNRQRINKIAFAGSATHAIYPERKKVVDILSPLGLLDNFETQKKEADYVDCLKNYICHLSGSSIYDVTPAKIFEIAASGSVLFTNNSTKYGIEKLFGGTYMTYEEDYSDVVEKAKLIIGSERLVEEMTKAARLEVLDKHTDKKRSSELLKILEHF